LHESGIKRVSEPVFRRQQVKQEMFHQHISMVSSIGRRIVVGLAAIAIGSLQSSDAFAQDASQCGALYTPGQYGPFDYRIATDEQKRLVEGTHFTPSVQALRAATTGTLGSDIAYTLGAFPNHPRALLAMSNLALRNKVAKPAGSKWSVTCYFDRAIRFQPDDSLVRLVYGMHLIRSGEKDAARVQLGIAEQNPIETGNFHYNLGLAFLDAGDADRALTHAWQASALGYELPGLRRRLEKIGKWRDPEK